MIYIENLITFATQFMKNFTMFNIDKIEHGSLSSEIFLYIQFSSATINMTVYFLIMLIIINFIYHIFFKDIAYLMQLLRFINLLMISIILTLLIIKFYFSLKLEQHLGPYLYEIKLNFFKENSTMDYFEHFIIFSSSFSDAILILSFLTGLICLELLGLKNLFKNVNNISIFYVFNLFVVIMVSTNNLLVMFLSFEFIFLPTMYFVYKLGYSKKIDKANQVLFY